MRSLLGHKGTCLAEMMQIGLPVPFGFTITTKACTEYFENGRVISHELTDEILEKMAVLESVTGREFGSVDNPLYVSVRADSPQAIPGLAQTVLNLGMNANSAEDAHEQLLDAISDAFDSWENSKAVDYRKKHNIPESVGVSVSIQAMVFGNAGDDSACGIISTRDPFGGQKMLTGSFMVNAQGLDFSRHSEETLDIEKMAKLFPKALESLNKISGILESHFKEAQRVEFTIEKGKLYILMCSPCELSTEGSLRVAIDMVSEGIITEKQALLRVNTDEIKELLRDRKRAGVGSNATGQGTKNVATGSADLAEPIDNEDGDMQETDELRECLSKLSEWADDIKELRVRANADNAEQARLALDYGAEGIGLCRTENLFFENEKLDMLRQLLTTQDEDERRDINASLKRMQKENFKEIYMVMKDRPVTIRLLDIPINDIVPMEEVNPMLGLRGARLELEMPRIAEAQTEAIIEAALEVRDELGVEIVPEILIPMVSSRREFVMIRTIISAAAQSLLKAKETEMNYIIGAMIETPRAALTASYLAQEADFFSFGTNDLTQMVYGLSREDAPSIIQTYVEKGVLTKNPFLAIDFNGVGRLVDMATREGKKANSKLKIGICGEQASDPESIEFCHKLGMNYISCSPSKVPAAKLAAAQAAVRCASSEEKR